MLEFEELCTHHPDLVGQGATRACVKRMFEGIRSNLHRWQHTLAAGPRPGLQQRQFRHTRTGQLLRARQAANAGDTTVPAWVFEAEPQTGAIRVTDEQGTLPADTSQSELCPTCLACSDAEDSDDEDPAVAGQEEESTQLGRAASVLAAKAGAFRHAALGPQGAPPVPDPRLLEWTIPETCKPEERVCLAYSTTEKTRRTYISPERGGSHAHSPHGTAPC